MLLSSSHTIYNIMYKYNLKQKRKKNLYVWEYKQLHRARYMSFNQIKKNKIKHKTYKKIYLWTVFHPSECAETKNRHLSLFTYNNEKHKFEWCIWYALFYTSTNISTYLYSHIYHGVERIYISLLYVCSLVSLKLKP